LLVTLKLDLIPLPVKLFLIRWPLSVQLLSN